MKKYGQADLMIFLVCQYISEQMKDVPESQKKRIKEKCQDEIKANFPTSREWEMIR